MPGLAPVANARSTCRRYSLAITAVSALSLFHGISATHAHGQSPKASSTAASVRALDGRRFRADSFWVRQWIRGGSSDAERFVEPRYMVVVDDAVVVLDVGTREVSAFDARTGSLRFSMAARGEGPGEFKRPSLLLARGTEFGVVDQATARLTMFSSRGAYLTDTPLTDAIALEGACLMSGGQLVAKVTGFDRALRTLDTSGIIRAQRSLPAPRRTSDNATFVSSAYVAGPAGQAACAIVPRFGSSWYVVAPSAAPIPHPYIEPGTDPSIEPTVKTLEKDWRSEIRTVTEISNIPPIARGALTIGDTLIVQAGATKRSPYLLLDYYHVPTGQYVYSRRLFAVFSALTMGADGAFYGALIGDENSAVVAFRPSIRRPAQNRASGIR